MHWLAHLLGLDSASGSPYLFWSGFFGDVSIIAAAWTLVRRHNCHARWCPLIGRFPVPGTPFTVCKLHSPERPPRARVIKARYHLYLGRKPGKG
jgi:hypothetical protein